MKIFVGLGNPGEKYKNNRHNAGHMFVDWADHLRGGRRSPRMVDATFLKTDCFMNVSGDFVKKLMSENRQLTTDNLFIVHDDLDIPLGKCKIQFGTGPKLHNGILSIEEELGTNEFWRIRIGVDNPSTRLARSGQVARVDGETYSLQDFTNEELKQLQPVFEKIYKQITQ